MNISDALLHIKRRKLTAVQRSVLNELDLLYDEVQSTRKSLKGLLSSADNDLLVVRKKVLVKLIKIRQHIRETIKKVFSAELQICEERHVTERRQTPLWASEFDVFVLRECEHLCQLREASTGIPWHVDHMIALRGKLSSGLHCGLNFQVIPAYINLFKNNKPIMQTAFEWLDYI